MFYFKLQIRHLISGRRRSGQLAVKYVRAALTHICRDYQWSTSWGPVHCSAIAQLAIVGPYPSKLMLTIFILNYIFRKRYFK